MIAARVVHEDTDAPGRRFPVGAHTALEVTWAHLSRASLLVHVVVTAHGRPMEVGRVNLLSVPSRRQFGAWVARRLREIDPTLAADAGLLPGVMFEMTNTLYTELSER